MSRRLWGFVLVTVAGLMAVTVGESADLSWGQRVGAAALVMALAAAILVATAGRNPQ